MGEALYPGKYIFCITIDGYYLVKFKKQKLSALPP